MRTYGDTVRLLLNAGLSYDEACKIAAELTRV